MPLVRVNRQLRSLDEPNTKPIPPATLQLNDPTFVPDRPAACGVPGVAGVWASAAIATSSDAAPAAVNIDRSMDKSPLVAERSGNASRSTTHLGAQSCMS